MEVGTLQTTTIPIDDLLHLYLTLVALANPIIGDPGSAHLVIDPHNTDLATTVPR